MDCAINWLLDEADEPLKLASCERRARGAKAESAPDPDTFAGDAARSASNDDNDAETCDALTVTDAACDMLCLAFSILPSMSQNQNAYQGVDENQRKDASRAQRTFGVKPVFQDLFGHAAGFQLFRLLTNVLYFFLRNLAYNKTSGP